MPYQYKHAVLGGTFDHLHAGHKHILSKAFESAHHVTIGVTSDDFVKEKELSSCIQSYDIRTQNLEKHISHMNLVDRVSFEKINDIYGSANTRDDIDAIIVTKDSEPNAHVLNNKRVENNLSKLPLIRISLLKDADDVVISSTRIRQGIINRKGNVFMDSFSQAQKHSLPQKIREQLQSPIGEVILGNMDSPIDTAQKVVERIRKMNPTMVIAVGDIIVQTLEQAGFIPQIEIIDYRTRRSDLSTKGDRQEVDAINPPGTITSNAVAVIESAIRSSQKTPKVKRIVINGEEDLLALPAILLAPLGSVIIYGQFDRGIVLVEANEEMKERIAEIIRQFE